MNNKYAIIIKTAEAEIRALEYTNPNFLNKIFPIVELTRGRKLASRKGEDSFLEKYPFDNRLQKIENIFKGQTICLDITSDENLTSQQIDKLYDPSSGYDNWITFLIKLKDKKCFKEIIPCILLNVEDNDFEKNLCLQVTKLKEHFSSIAYRNSLFDENCYDDFDLLKKELETTNLYVIVDCGYVIQASQHDFGEKSLARIINLKGRLKSNTKYILSSTSFPNNISDIGNEIMDSFKLSELDVFDKVKRVSNDNLIYSDYATINPIRNDGIVMARGWIPRIDVPLLEEIFYYRKRRPKGTTVYSQTYNDVAVSVVNDVRFPKRLTANWGVQQIINCSKGMTPSSSPSFWISVRMNIHIEQQLERLKII